MDFNNNGYFKYAIFGGSFDPIHKAHIFLADYAVNELNLDKLYFMPASVSPFKQNKETLDAKHRYNMIEQILYYNDKFELSDYEIIKKRPSYSIETLNEWNSRNLGKLYFVVGFDALVTLDKWYKGNEILSKFSIITGKRPIINRYDVTKKIEYYKTNFGSDITILDMPEFNISSSNIREKVKNGISIKEDVLRCTEEYIIDHKLYR